MRYSLYIGRFQPFHEGHEWCINEILKKGKKVCVAIMDINGLEPENNPYTFEEVSNTITKKMSDEIEQGKLVIAKIPAIDSVNYGREVGYEFIEHLPPNDVKKISATKIRNNKISEDK
jgi:cytidyltransferase-like protein